jgi:hypothetical protein
MSIIEASSVSVKTMADGTLRVSMDVEPRHAQAAFALFGAPGTPMALAALKTATSAPPESEVKEEPKRAAGPICQWLVMRCQDREFREWLYRHSQAGPGNDTEERAAEICRELCDVESRKDIDGNVEAERLFKAYIRRPWNDSRKHTPAKEPAERAA